ncbi:MAG: ABC transporter ATP-binding protein [Acidimicrobiales bacterium]|jgi:ABC-2 type transport system ATP-binding protein
MTIDRSADPQSSSVPDLAAPQKTLYAVEVSGLTKRFGDRTVVDNVELRVRRGIAFGYLGPNGAGKTTLIRMLLGLTPANGGTMRVLGHPVPAERDRALARVGAIVDEPRFHGYLSGRENLRILSAAREPAARDRIDPALQRVGLAERADERVGKYSMGMRQRLGIAACLLADPELLVLDEPMNGLDPAGIIDVRNMIRGFVAEGRTVVLSSHLLDEVEKTCDEVAIVDRGRLVAEGPIDQVTASAAQVLQIGCGDPRAAADLVRANTWVSDVTGVADGLSVTLHAGIDGRQAAAYLNWQLVSNRIAVFDLQISRASLEERFLEVTSTLESQP